MLLLQNLFSDLVVVRYYADFWSVWRLSQQVVFVWTWQRQGCLPIKQQQSVANSFSQFALLLMCQCFAAQSFLRLETRWERGVVHSGLHSESKWSTGGWVRGHNDNVHLQSMFSNTIVAVNHIVIPLLHHFDSECKTPPYLLCPKPDTSEHPNI